LPTRKHPDQFAGDPNNDTEKMGCPNSLKSALHAEQAVAAMHATSQAVFMLVTGREPCA